MGKKVTDSKGFYIAASILIAIVLWLFVVSEVNPTAEATVRGLPISYTGEDLLAERGLLISGTSRPAMNLYFSGNRLSLVRLDHEKPTVSADVSSITGPGEFSLPCKVTLPNTVTSGSVQLTEKNNLEVIVTVSKALSKSVSVRGKFEGTVAEGYQMGTFSISPQLITITGQEDHVNQIAYAQVRISQEDMDESFSGELGFTLMNALREELSNLNVRCSVDTVHVTLPVVKVKEVPLTVDFIEGGGATVHDLSYEIVPETISVSGKEADLDGLDKINLGSIDLSKILNADTFTFEILLANELYNESGVTHAVVTVKIEGLSTKVMETDNIQINNVPDGYSATAVTQSLQVVVRGKEEILSLVLEHQLRIVADLKDTPVSAGQFKVPAKVYLDGGSGAGVVGDYTISINVSR